MVKGFAVRIHAVMTGHAVCPECQNMCLGKRLVYFQVAIDAGGLVKGSSITVDMAIFTGCGFMSRQFERGGIVIEACVCPICGSVAGTALIS